MCREIMKKLRETYGNEYFDGKHGAYDGEKSLFTSGCLPFKSMKFSVLLDNFEGSSCRPGDSGRPSSGTKCIANRFTISTRRGICAERHSFVLLNCSLPVVQPVVEQSLSHREGLHPKLGNLMFQLSWLQRFGWMR